MTDNATRPRFSPLAIIETLGNKLPDPAILFLLGTILVMILSAIGAASGWSAQPKKVELLMVETTDPATGETSIVPELDEDGNTVSVLVDDLSKNNGKPYTINSLLTADGIYYAISSMVGNFINFPPLGVVLVGMLGIGLAERTGFIPSLLKGAMLIVPKRLLTPAMVFLGIMSSAGVDAGYVVLPPIAAMLYVSVGRSPLAGIAAVFAGVSAGFNANLLITGLDPMLAAFSTDGAQSFDADYNVAPTANWWFMIVSTFLITAVGWFTADVLVERRYKGLSPEQGGPTALSPSSSDHKLTGRETRGMWAGIASVVVVTGVFVAFTLVPKMPFDDTLRDTSGVPITLGELRATHEALRGTPTDKPRVTDLIESGVFQDRDTGSLMRQFRHEGEQRDPDTLTPIPNRLGPIGQKPADAFSRWATSIVPMLFFLFVTPAIVYGLVAKTVKSSRQVVTLMTETMASMAPIIVLAFFAAQFIEYFKYSQLDKVLAYRGGELLATSNLSKESLILAFIALTMLFNLFVGSMSAKYAMFAPIFVPMLMFVGISPELTQCAYRIGDSTTNIITPLNSYLIIILVVMQKYAPKAGMGTLISMMTPFAVTFTIAWTALLLVWMYFGWELGPDAPLEYTRTGN